MEEKYVEVPPLKWQCWGCGKYHEFTAMVPTASLKPDLGARIGGQTVCKACGTVMDVLIQQHISPTKKA